MVSYVPLDWLSLFAVSVLGVTVTTGSIIWYGLTSDLSSRGLGQSDLAASYDGSGSRPSNCADGSDIALAHE